MVEHPSSGDGGFSEDDGADASSTPLDRQLTHTQGDSLQLGSEPAATSALTSAPAPANAGDQPQPRGQAGHAGLESELGTFQDVARQLASGSNSREVLSTLCRAAEMHGRASGASVASVFQDSGTFIATSGIASPLLDIDFPLRDSVTARVVAEGRPIAIAEPGESSRFFAELLPRLGAGPAMMLPLRAQNELMGVLSVLRRAGDSLFTEQDIARLSTVADLAALALLKTRLIEETRAADAAKTSLLATLSHELRTPLAALEGYGELLEDEIMGPLAPEQRDVIGRLRTVSRHLGSLIEDILTFASIEADSVSLRKGKIRIDELLDSLRPFIEPLAGERGIQFSISVEPALPALFTDEARVRQILLNLCQNAVKFTEIGEVVVSASRGAREGDDQRTVRIAIRDTGVGIPSRDLQRLFRPFSQLEDTKTRRPRGTGLGLYISQRLATLLRGRIDVQSRQGEGSVFTLVLPVEGEQH